ncbi:hypothetical protein SLEP1_g1461 [Rubroshorea leprosula]|uniref:Uncharacterized protein n=1 Tax=Rubroshorea leprosula TaxID=152421 RepID=A0AAV5HMK6_9ROSI|nr:hypothetical protein SLEP1_g1461 [Rubroshorea leprosula]
MGNSVSSCFIPQLNSKKKARVIDAEGNLRRVKLPAKAGELMVEEPGHVVSMVDQLRVTRRVSAVRADDELLAGKVYMLVPICRVNCRVTEAEMERIEAACSEKKRKEMSRKKRRGGKVSPAVTGPEEFRKEEDSRNEVLRTKIEIPCYRKRRNYAAAPWSPGLETISEK